jgi:glyoxylase-like metal-dependent hydrolase (beta-lactamase superfamily II)
VIEAVPGHDALRVRAANPSPLTLDGSNTWVLGRYPAWVVDPGPALDEHLEAVAREVGDRGGAGAILVTHTHPDHVEGVPRLVGLLGGEVPVAAMAWEDADTRLADGDALGPLTAIHVPGHVEDHLCFRFGRACCTGDAVMGAGSVFISPGPGALSGYLDGLRRLRALDLEVILPGHGPVVGDPAARLDEYVAHRLEREEKLLAGLAAGARSEEELLDAAWADVPAELRFAAAITLQAHLGKLAEEGRLPEDF